MFLVHHDPVGRRQDRLQAFVEILDAVLALLALDEIRDEFHRTGAEQGDQRDDVFEAVGPGLFQQLTHAARFELEHCRGISTGKHLERSRIVERKLLEPDLGIGIEALDEAQCPVEDGERGQAEEVELHQSDRFHVVLVELRHRAVRTGRRV